MERPKQIDVRASRRFINALVKDIYQTQINWMENENGNCKVVQACFMSQTPHKVKTDEEELLQVCLRRRGRARRISPEFPTWYSDFNDRSLDYFITRFFRVLGRMDLALTL